MLIVVCPPTEEVETEKHRAAHYQLNWRVTIIPKYQLPTPYGGNILRGQAACTGI
jgi:hypothetical protein